MSYRNFAANASIERASMPEQSDREREVADAARRVATLSRREHQVLEALAAGQPNKIIAYHLGLSVRTVELHRARMMERLDVQQFAEAIRLAVLARFAAPDDSSD
jgi:two-component system response regulator FixJ